MTLALPSPSIDSSDFSGAMQGIQQNFDVLARQFPVNTNSLGGQVTGTVGSTGTIIRGDSFTVTKTGTGTYTVTFNFAFGNPPVVLLTVDTTAGITIIRTENVLVSSFGVVASTDCNFSFLAQGA